MIGDSFVRRLRDDLTSRCAQSQHERKWGFKDVSQTQPARAALLAHQLRLDNEFVGVYTESNHLQRVADLPQASFLLHHVRPEVVIINVGSNDLAQLEREDRDAVLNLAVGIHAFASGIQHAKLVILSKVLYRTQGMKCSPAVFAKNADMLNTFLRNMCCDAGSPATVFNPLRGFTFVHDDAETPKPRPVVSWSTDGIHCNTLPSMSRYQERQRLFVLDNLHLVKKSG